MREGVVIFDLATTGLNTKRDHILQLSAVKLSSNNYDEYNDYACPGVDIHPRATDVHGLTYESFYWTYARNCDVIHHRRLERNGNVIDDPFQSEEDLLGDFADWLEEKYDRVCLIHHSAWKLSMLTRSLDAYDIELPDYESKDIREILRPYREQLNLDNESLAEILWQLNGEGEDQKSQDVLDNVVNMRTSLYNAADRLKRYRYVTNVRDLVGK